MSRSRPTRRLLGAAKLTGRVGRFSIGALNAITTREDAHLASGPALDESTSPVEPLTSYSVARANREFANQSRLGFMSRARTGRLTDELRFLPTRPSPAASTATGASERPLQPHRLLGGQHGARRRRGHRSPAAEQRPQLPAAGRRPPDVRPARGRARAVTPARSTSTRSAASARAATRTSDSRSPGFDVNDLGFQSRADDISHQQLVSGPRRQARQVRPDPEHQLQPVGRVELRRRPPLLGRQRQQPLDVHEQLEHRQRLQRQRRRLRRSAHARRTGRARSRQPESVGLRRHPTSARRSRQLLQLLVVQRPARLAAAGASIPASTTGRPRRSSSAPARD